MMTAPHPNIRDVTDGPLEPNAALVRQSFQTVADSMGITPENAPRYTAFITAEDLRREREAGSVFYGYFVDGTQTGFVAVVQEDDGGWHMKRLAVLPGHRGRRVAEGLIERVIEHVKEQGGTKLHIGIVREQAGLKKWYERMGFVEYRVWEIPHLPFTVSLLAKDLDHRGEEA